MNGYNITTIHAPIKDEIDLIGEYLEQKILGVHYDAATKELSVPDSAVEWYREHIGDASPTDASKQ